MHTIARLIGGCLSAVAASAALAQFGTEPAELDLIKLADDLFVTHNPYVPGNATVLVTDEGVLLVDDKFPIDYDNIAAMIESLTDEPVKYVVNTHHHSDHSGGNASFQSAGAIAIASEQARERMLAGNQTGLPDVTVVERGNVYIGGETVEIHWLGRAHTDGDVVVLFPRHRVLASGDVYANDPGTPELIDYAGGGSAVEWTATLDRVLELDFDTVVPGHGTPASKEALREFRDTSERLTELVSQLARQNRSRDDIEQVMRSEFGRQDFHVQMGLAGLIDELER
jgi:glyoxylase-like metal-dependent hydrolase (beta-lactamase superfamily II)